MTPRPVLGYVPAMGTSDIAIRSREEQIARLQGEIKALAREQNAVILAHNYERAEVQDVADYVGDSLGLSREAAKTDADVIVFCGVHFMAETAAVLSPQKTMTSALVFAASRDSPRESPT